MAILDPRGTRSAEAPEHERCRAPPWGGGSKAALPSEQALSDDWSRSLGESWSELKELRRDALTSIWHSAQVGVVEERSGQPVTLEAGPVVTVASWLWSPLDAPAVFPVGKQAVGS